MKFKLPSKLATLFIFFISSISIMASANIVPGGTLLAQKQELTINNGSDAATLDPQKMEGVPEANIARQLFEGLVNSDKDGNIIPGVATDWESSDDFKVWTFHLRKEAKWSNGDQVTAHDFVFAWQRLADPKTASPYSSYLEYLQVVNANDVTSGLKPVSELGVRAVDDHTLEVTLAVSVPYAYKLTEHSALYPNHRQIIETHGDAWTAKELVGNGAFKLGKWTINEKIELVRNQQYWNDKYTVLDKVTFLPITSPNTDFARYRAGDEDITNNKLPTELFPMIKKELADELYIMPTLCNYFYEINNKKAPFNNVKVREGLKLGLDRNIITDKVMAQGQLPGYSFAPPYIESGEKIIKPDWFEQSQAERNKRGIELLTEAGFSKQQPLTLTLLYNTNENHKKVAIAVASIWQKNLGGLVKVKLENQEWKTYLDSRNQGNYDVARAGWCADYNEATSFLNYFLSNSSNNSAGYNSPEYDSLLASSYHEGDDDKRAQIYAEAEMQLDKDSAFIPIYNQTSTRLIKPYVKGFTVTHPADYFYLKDVYLVKLIP